MAIFLFGQFINKYAKNAEFWLFFLEIGKFSLENLPNLPVRFDNPPRRKFLYTSSPHPLASTSDPTPGALTLLTYDCTYVSLLPQSVSSKCPCLWFLRPPIPTGPHSAHHRSFLSLGLSVRSRLPWLGQSCQGSKTPQWFRKGCARPSLPLSACTLSWRRKSPSRRPPECTRTCWNRFL